MDKIIKELNTFAINIDALSFDPSNARTHNDKNIEAIKSSLAAFGQRTPIVVQKSNMVVRAGNGRLEAAKRLGWDKIAALVVDDDDVQATAYAIADNRTGELAEWDDRVLSEMLGSLDDELKIGWDNKDLNKMMNEMEDLQEVTLDDLKENCLFVSCNSENELRELFEELSQRGLEVKLV